MLRVEQISKHFGGLVALNQVSLDVQDGSIVGLIGPNGSGKSTLFNVISGVLTPNGGKVWFGGTDLTGVPPHVVAAAGIGRTFQHVRLFGDMSVLENVLVGQHVLKRPKWQSWIPRSLSRAERPLVEKAEELLEFLGLADRRNDFAGELAYGLQRRLEIARALAGRPALLLLDEPAAGMNDEEVAVLKSDIVGIRDRGTAVVVIEHHMGLVMDLCDYVAVLNFGQKLAGGKPEDIGANPQVIEAYLGADISGKVA